jgi:hypothetical protein
MERSGKIVICSITEVSFTVEEICSVNGSLGLDIVPYIEVLSEAMRFALHYE